MLYTQPILMPHTPAKVVTAGTSEYPYPLIEPDIISITAFTTSAVSINPSLTKPIEIMAESLLKMLSKGLPSKSITAESAAVIPISSARLMQVILRQRDSFAAP